MRRLLRSAEEIRPTRFVESHARSVATLALGFPSPRTLRPRRRSAMGQLGRVDDQDGPAFQVLVELLRAQRRAALECGRAPQSRSSIWPAPSRSVGLAGEQSVLSWRDSFRHIFTQSAGRRVRQSRLTARKVGVSSRSRRYVRSTSTQQTCRWHTAWPTGPVARAETAAPFGRRPKPRPRQTVVRSRRRH